MGRQISKSLPLVDREIGWLGFNARVLQEAKDPSVPLLERLKFLGIFSSNLDEFFRVRVASLRRNATLKIAPNFPNKKPDKVLTKIQEIVIQHQAEFEEIFKQLTNELEKNNIFLINELRLSPDQASFVKQYFAATIRPSLVPIMLNQINEMPELKGHAIYQAVTMTKSSRKKKEYALIEIPTESIPRFVVLPGTPNAHYVILLEDIIRFCLSDIFALFDYDQFSSYTIKLTRDAEIDLDDDILKSYIDKLQKSISQRRHGQPVRFIYEEKISKDLLQFLIKKLGISRSESLIPVRRRYHNFKDFIKFPRIGSSDLVAQEYTPKKHPILTEKSIISVIQNRDVLLHYPYHSFDSIVDLLREAAIDPKVVSIKMTLYRVAPQSNIINSLVNAIRNGKEVTIVIELQARFDEEANIKWSKVLAEEGAKIIVGVPHLKVHAKVCLIARQESSKIKLYANVATGNFNETTAQFYTDHSLLTSDKRITADISKLFEFFENNTHVGRYNHIIVSPFNLRKKLSTFIDQEIKNQKLGKLGQITVKLNGLTDAKIIEKLYEASQAGVDIRLIVRGTCMLVAGVKNISKSIIAISIVDQFLEHSRIYHFRNGGDDKVFIASSDWMTRSFDNRIEVACPIYDPALKNELMTYLKLQLSDTVKARLLTTSLNKYQTDGPILRSQHAIHALVNR